MKKILFGLLIVIAFTSCGTTKHFYKKGACEEIDNGTLCEE